MLLDIIINMLAKNYEWHLNLNIIFVIILFYLFVQSVYKWFLYEMITIKKNQCQASNYYNCDSYKGKAYIGRIVGILSSGVGEKSWETIYNSYMFANSTG